MITWVRISTVTSLLCWVHLVAQGLSFSAHLFKVTPVFVEIIVENVFQVFGNVFHKLSFDTKLLQYHNFQQ